MMNRVVVAINGSPACMQALDVAAKMIAPSGTVLCVDVEDIMAFYREYAVDSYEGEMAEDAEFFRNEWNKEARKIKEDVLHKASDLHLAAEWHILKLKPGQGGPAEALYKFAQREKAEAILVGQHRGSHLIEGLLGSFPRWLVTHSALPVVVVPPPQSKEARAAAGQNA
ncbi:universal stress protein [Sulfobacillus sp. hq2]|uniref:universal stress protein n=1 Tax=Sulfobacillus TaxID=28033 RepID=UPI0013050259|nr:universal stress protein [Sulfobacillus sp. hq2]